MFHRFSAGPSPRSTSVRDFEEQLDYLARHCAPMRLDAYIAACAAGRPLPRRPAIVTVDDGYRDFIDYAYPRLVARGIPATLFVVTASADGEWLWFDRLRYLLDHAAPRRFALPSTGLQEALDLESAAGRESAWERIADRCLKLGPAPRQALLDDLAAALGLDVPGRVTAEYAGADFDALRALDAGLVEIGSHTITHPILTRCTDDELAGELVGSRARLERELGRPVTSFCYPNGMPADYDARVARAVAAAGYACAVAAHGGLARTPRAPLDRYLLARIGNSPRREEFRNEISGVTQLKSDWWARRRAPAPVAQTHPELAPDPRPLRIERHPSFDGVGADRWRALHAAAAGATVFQTWSWLTAWWSVFGADRELALYVASEGGRPVGVLALYRHSDDGELRFVGDEHADYQNALVPADRPDVLRALLARVRKDAPRIRFAEVRTDTPLATALEATLVDTHGTLEGEMPCPRLSFSARLPAEILAKQSLRRHARQLRARGEVAVLHLATPGDVQPWLAPFFRQHVERWAVRGEPSLFVRPGNRTFYERLAQDPEFDLRFTVVTLDGRPVAMHFGFVSEGDLVWYKPSFDVRLAQAGPGEVLLAALVEWAAGAGLAGLDFTRGGEAFKGRFASEVRSCRTYLWHENATAAALHRRLRAARAQGGAWLRAAGLRAAASSAATAGRAVRRGELREVVAAMIARRRARATGRVLMYAADPPAQDRTAAGEAGIRFLDCATLAALLDAVDCTQPDLAGLLKSAPPRFESGDAVHLALDGGAVVAYGWSSAGPTHPISEIGRRWPVPEGSRVLYDFHVVPSARGRGLYPRLLAAVRAALAPARIYIYALEGNAASRRGIERAGFVEVERVARES